jgi:hypothetical protein
VFRHPVEFCLHSTAAPRKNALARRNQLDELFQRVFVSGGCLIDYEDAQQSHADSRATDAREFRFVLS